MTSPQAQAPTGDASLPGLLERLGQRSREIGFVLFGLAAAGAVLLICFYVAWGQKALGPVFSWGVLLVLSATIAGTFCILRPPDAKLTEGEKLRLILFVLGGAVGLVTALLGLILPFTTFRDTFGGGAEEWRKHSSDILFTALALGGGLALSFASVQLGRGVERQNALMRRLLYGFSALFTTLLLTAILLVLNVWPYAFAAGGREPVGKFLSSTYDWTQSRIYTLSERSRNTLTGLTEPVKVYVLLPQRDPLATQVETLLENCRGVTPKISWETLSVLDRERFQQLANDYKLPDSLGILVVYSEKPKEQSHFITRDNLFTVESNPDAMRDPEAPQRELFQGEAVLMKTIRTLAEGKPIVYFTQGDDELDMNDRQPRSTDGMGVLIDTMRQNEVYELKELKLTDAAAKVPDDAAVVVIARPDKLKPGAVKALCNYAGYTYDENDHSIRDDPKGRKGKLFVLMDVAVEDKQMLQTGLEPLLGKFGVQAGNDRILTLSDPTHPTDLDVAASKKSTNPVAQAFLKPNREVFHFKDVRTVTHAPTPPPTYALEDLVVTDIDPVWVETDFTKSPLDLAAAKAKQTDARFADEPLTVAVAVSDSKNSGMPNDPFHASVSTAGEPRLVVFGDAGWVANAGLLGARDGEAKYSLFISCLSWLRQQPDIGVSPEQTEETKVRVPFQVSLKADDLLTMQFLPLAQMVLAIIAAGIGVWLVRRR